MAKMILKVTVNDPYFQYQLRVSQDANLVIPAQICDDLSYKEVYGQTERQMQTMTIPLCPELPTGKNHSLHRGIDERRDRQRD